MQFSYVQIGARDYQSLAAFYKEALEFAPCEDTKWLRGNEGVTLSAPGFEKGKEMVFGFIKAENGAAGNINDKGYAHLCFETDNVNKAVKRFVKHGGSFVSTLKHPFINPCVYCRDPEGNIVEFHVPFGAGAKTVGSLLMLRPYKGLRFIHVNIITDDWQKLCAWYNGKFGSTDTGDIKDHSGSYKSKVIGIENVHVLGRHILLPGFYDTYPTLEIFTYNIKGNEDIRTAEDIGINCIGFAAAPDAKSIIMDKDGQGAPLLIAE